MNNIPEGKVCSRKGCNDLAAVRKDSTTFYCEKHSRFKEMRSRARKDSKKVPSWEQCEEMLKPCLNDHGELGACPCCGRQMQWRAGKGRKIRSTVSLQHNHDETECFICLSCNSAHGQHKDGDGFYLIKKGHKKCPTCGIEKPFDQFNKNRTKRNGCCSECRECSLIRYKNQRGRD